MDSSSSTSRVRTPSVTPPPSAAESWLLAGKFKKTGSASQEMALRPSSSSSPCDFYPPGLLPDHVYPPGLATVYPPGLAAEKIYLADQLVPSTVMLRNLPGKCTRQMILAEIARRGVISDIDFFYLPFDPRNRANFGYCFVNCTSADGKTRVTDAFHATPVSDKKTVRLCEVSDARLQGREANMEACRQSPVVRMAAKHHPILIVDGVVTHFLHKSRESNKTS